MILSIILTFVGMWIFKDHNLKIEGVERLPRSLADLGMCIPTDEDSKESKSAILTALI